MTPEQKTEIRRRLRRALPHIQFGRWREGRGWASLTARCPDGWRLDIFEHRGWPGTSRSWFVFPSERGPLTEEGSGYLGRGWAPRLCDDVAAAVLRIGTRDACARCQGEGREPSAPDLSCGHCLGAGLVAVSVEAFPVAEAVTP